MTARPVPDFPQYLLSLDGTLTRRGRIKSPHRPFQHGQRRHPVYALWRNGRQHNLSLPQLLEMTFSTDQQFDRWTRGEQSHRAVLTEPQVRQILDLIRQGLADREIVRVLDLPTTVSAVWAIRHGRTWRHIRNS